jgi:replication factor A1
LKRKKPSISEYLASLSVQYGLYPAELFQSLISARENKKAQLEGLTIEYRGSVDGEAIFLIKQDGNVAGQFRVEEETLTQKDVAFDKWMDTDKIRKQIAKQNPAEPVTFQVINLRQGMKKVNLQANVINIEEPRLVHTQFGNSALLANAIVEDETGKIKLCLWDQQVKSVVVGDKIQLNNAMVSLFKGEKQLRLGKTGLLTVIEPAQPTPKEIKKSNKSSAPEITV